MGAVYYFLIHPHILNALQWFADNLAFSFVVGMFFGVFAVDVVYSLGIVTKVRAFAKENDILVRYEELRQQIRQHSEENREKLHWFLRFASKEQLRDHLQRYLELQEAFKGNPMDEWRDNVLKQYKKNDTKNDNN